LLIRQLGTHSRIAGCFVVLGEGVATCCCCCCLQVDNKSTTDVPAVEFYLHQKLKLTAQTMWGSKDKHFSSTRIHQR
jgi:hypothetical protein